MYDETDLGYKIILNFSNTDYLKKYKKIWNIGNQYTQGDKLLVASWDEGTIPNIRNYQINAFVFDSSDSTYLDVGSPLKG